MASINTPSGKYKYKPVALYPGIKQIDKEIAKDNLLLLKQLMDSYEIPFMLSYGTLLGAVREHDFITHDEDIDLIIKEGYRDKFLTSLHYLRDAGFELVRFDRRDIYSIMRNGEYIDIYIFRPTSGGLWTCSGAYLADEFMRAEDEVEFLGQNFCTHSNHIGMLECQYGSDWRTPHIYNNYLMSKMSKCIFRLVQWGRSVLPKWIFNYIMKMKDEKKLPSYINKINQYRELQSHREPHNP